MIYVWIYNDIVIEMCAAERNIQPSSHYEIFFNSRRALRIWLCKKYAGLILTFKSGTTAERVFQTGCTNFRVFKFEQSSQLSYNTLHVLVNFVIKLLRIFFLQHILHTAGSNEEIRNKLQLILKKIRFINITFNSHIQTDLRMGSYVLFYIDSGSFGNK